MDSPTDGYFSNRSHPQDSYSQLRASSDNDRKTHEAQEEQDLSPISTPPRTQYTPSSPTWSDETSSLLSSIQPPPAYSGPSRNHVQRAPSYQTVPGDDIRQYVAPAPISAFRNGRPQSMGDPMPDYDDNEGLYARPSRRRRSLRDCCSCNMTLRTVLAVGAGVLVLLFLIMTTFRHDPQSVRT